MGSSQPGFLPSPLGKLVRRLKEFGVLGSLIRLGDHFLDAVSRGHCRLHGYALIAQPLGRGVLVPPDASGSTTVRPLAADDVLANDLPRPLATNQARWAAGARCMVATWKGVFAGTVWFSLGSHEEDEVRCTYKLADPARSAWDFDLFLAPQYRASRLFARMWQEVDRQLSAQGVEWTFSRISLLNRASLTAHKRMQARRVGTAVFLVAGPVQLSLLSQAPFVHLSINGTRGPTLLLHPPRPSKARTDGAAPASAHAPAPPVALVLGLDSHGLAVARALASAGVEVYALEPDPGVPGTATKNVREVFYLKDFSESHLIPALRRVRKELRRHAQVVLIANNDRQVTAVAKHRDELSRLYRISWTEQAATILKLQCKDELEAFSVAQGLRYPKSALFDEICVPATGHGLQFPVILKPVQPLSSFKTLIAQDDNQLLQHLGRHRGALPILAQEYVAGDDTSIFFGALMLDRGRVLHGMAGRKILSHPPARGQTTIAETVDQPEVVALTEQFFLGTQLSGPVSLELKRDPQGRFWVIEPTVGRTDFWAELCIGAGFNQPLIEFELAAGLPVSKPGAMTPCVWYDTERDPVAWLRLCWAEKSWTPRHAGQRFPYHGHADWRPLMRALKRTARSRLVGLLSARRPAVASLESAKPP